MELAAALHHSRGGGPATHDGLRAQKAASVGEEPGTQHYKLDDDESVPELGGGRPDPVLDPGPPAGGMRHSGVGYEILLDVRVPRLGQDWGELPAADEELAVRRHLAQAIMRSPGGAQALEFRACGEDHALQVH